MSLVAEAVSKAFGTEKMYSEENRPSEQVLEEMKQKLREELDKKYKITVHSGWFWNTGDYVIKNRGIIFNKMILWEK